MSIKKIKINCLSFHAFYFLQIKSWKILKSIFLIFWNISGLKFISQKIYPPKENDGKQKPSTIIIWIVSIYIGAYGISSGLYENRRDSLETQISFLVTQFSISKKSRKAAMARIPKIQNTEIPIKPKFISFNSFIDFFTTFWSPVNSLFHTQKDEDIVNQLKGFIEDEKNNLSEINLEFASLESASFQSAVLTGTNLKGAILRNADLQEANLQNSDLQDADLSNANLAGADLTNSNLLNTDFTGADLSYTILDGCLIERTKLENAILRSVSLKNAYLINLEKNLLENFSDDVEFCNACVNPYYCDLEFSYINSNCLLPIIYFDIDRSDIKESEKKKLDRIVSIMKSYFSLKLLIEGHTGFHGSADYNLVIGERKATAVKNYLIKAGIDPNRLSTISFGEEYAYQPNGKEDVRKLEKKNRRVSFKWRE